MARGRGGLPAKQQRFVEEFLVDGNVTQAAIRAGYSERTARSIAQENLTKPDIATAIEAGQRARSTHLGITADDIARELAKLGFANMADYLTVGEDGQRPSTGRASRATRPPRSRKSPSTSMSTAPATTRARSARCASSWARSDRPWWTWRSCWGSGRNDTK